MHFESVGQYHDALAAIVLSAPDRFQSFDDEAVDQNLELERRFRDLRDQFHWVEKKLKEPRLARICRELIDISHEAYKAGDAKRGAHTLQECEGLIWKNRHVRLKHVVEAERRAFESVELFKDVIVSPYPYEGSEADLGDVQRRLWLQLESEYQHKLNEPDGIRQLWGMQRDGSISLVKARSFKAAREQVSERIERGELIGIATAELLPHGGLRVFDIEESGRALVSVRILRKAGSDEAPRFHLDAPVAFKARGNPGSV
ncbi:hypothetical protein ACEN9J_11865 [Variovorax sp. Varisp41]|uniref:hypothetical protein n=1 Tax=Variovorax sp. Varisp41 TaxID=3243033 RepID=UPI0039B37A17